MAVVITDAIGSVFFTVVGGLIQAVLPTGSAETLPTVTGLLHWYTWANGFLPLSEAVVMFGLLYVVYGVVFAFRLAKTLWSMVPTPLSGHG